MKRARSLLTGAAALAAFASGAAAKDVPQYDAATLYDTVTIFGGSFSPDESKILISSDETGVFNAYAIDIISGEKTRLTESDTDAMYGVSYFPRDERILVTSDEGGNELNHLYVRERDGEMTDLTPGENLKASFAGWRSDDKAFFALTNERDNRYFDLYEYSADEYDRSMVFRNEGGFQISDISRDGRWVAMIKVRNNVDDDIYIWDAENPSADPKHITPHSGDVSHNVFTFTPDSRRLIYGSNEGSEFVRAYSYNLADGEREMIIEDPNWDISGVGFSEKGTYRVVSVNADARTRLTIRNTRTGRMVELPNIPRGDIAGVSFPDSESKMSFYVNGDTAPSNLFIYDFETGKHRKLTDTLSPKVEQEHLVESTVVRYESFDGLEIPALLYKPHQASAENPVPALVWVHGGPGGQSRTGYRADIQFLVNHGYAILAVNNRGSSGYGKTFFHLDDQRHGEDDLQDCVYGRRYLETLDWIDDDSIGIIGGSYGGFMVAAALAFEPEVFDVGINIFGVTNWLRTLKSIPPWWEDFKEYLYAEMGDPAEDEERLRRISPLFHAENIQRPLMVVQGANDPRVLQVESDELVEAARKNGVPVEYIIFPDEGHGFRKKENRITAAEGYLHFLNRYLRDN